MQTVRWSDEATTDLVEIIDFIERRNAAASQNLHAAIVRSTENLPLMPYLFRPGRVAGTANTLTRPSSARLACRLLTVFLTWCADQPAYASLLPAKTKKAREALGKAGTKKDVLQKGQLAAFIAACIQMMLLTGASATAEKHYTVRPLELLRLHHERIEAWILGQAGIVFDAKAAPGGLRAVGGV